MPGPEPKPADQRRNRSVPAKVAQRVVLPREGRKGRAPKPRTDVDLHPLSEELWRDWWRSPMATQWEIPTDVYPLTRLLLLYDELHRTGEVDKKGLTELRQLEARFGLDPRGRKELCWVIGEPESAPQVVRPRDEVARKRRERIAATG